MSDAARPFARDRHGLILLGRPDAGASDIRAEARSNKALALAGVDGLPRS
jgi:hypothetical protein